MAVLLKEMRCTPLRALEIIRRDLDRNHQFVAAAYVSMAIDSLKSDTPVDVEQ